ncbi:MAG TPA: tyrosine--tRNA ligase, partial [Patescibacteria group bacterium]|nr:tyrosine--tRNA ligase [Patescibacteria group bacterium]
MAKPPVKYAILEAMDAIQTLLSRGVDKIYPSREEVEKVLRGGKKLTLYQGFDPTGVQMHLGHMIGLRKLAQWQKLGHKVIFLIGDGTGQAGDPSGKTRSREKYLTNEQLRQNARDYVMQASKIVSFEGENPVEIKYNGDWLNKMTLADVLEVAGHFTLQQMIERDLYQERLKNNEPLNLREFLYPLLQGYDSVAMAVDLELGGSDQTFNMLAGRQLVKEYLNKEKYVMTTPLLTDSTGRKIGKTEGNVIGLNDKPDDLYAKIMALGDDVIVKGFEYLTDIPLTEIGQIEQAIQNGDNPLTFKKKLAFAIVEQFHGKEKAEQAQVIFTDVVQGGKQPQAIEEIHLKDEGEFLNEDLLVSLNLASSKS